METPSTIDLAFVAMALIILAGGFYMLFWNLFAVNKKM